MAYYRIENTLSGIDFGFYEGTSREDALNAFAVDAGYSDYDTMNAQFPVEEGEISVTINDPMDDFNYVGSPHHY
jgi:hypothetical protein